MADGSGAFTNQQWGQRAGKEHVTEDSLPCTAMPRIGQIKAIMVVDSENYVRTKPGNRYGGLIEEMIKSKAVDEELSLPLGFYPYLQRFKLEQQNSPANKLPDQALGFDLTGKLSTEWERALKQVLGALGFYTSGLDEESTCRELLVEPVECRKFGKKMADLVSADVRSLGVYAQALRKQHLEAENVHVVFVGEEKEARDRKDKRERRHMCNKLRSFIGHGLVPDEELLAFLNMEDESIWADQSEEDSDAGCDPDSEEDFDAGYDWEGDDEAWETIFGPVYEGKVAELVARTDKFLKEKILAAALQQVCRMQLKRLGVTVHAVPEVKADVVIADLARRLKPGTLVIASNDTDFFQVRNRDSARDSVLMQLNIHGRPVVANCRNGLTLDDYGSAFTFKCALLGKYKRPKDASGTGSIMTALGPCVPAGVSHRDVINYRVDGTAETDEEYKTKFMEFIALVGNKTLWRLGLDEILKVLNAQFGRFDPLIGCRFLSNVLLHNIVPDEAHHGAGKHVLNVYAGQDMYEEIDGVVLGEILGEGDSEREPQLADLRAPER
jgi:hypothetical protein